MKQTHKEQIRGFALWTMIVIVVVILVAAIIAFSFVFPRETKRVPKPSQSEYKTSPPGEKPDVTVDYLDNCRGTIMEIDDNKIRLYAEEWNNPIPEDMIYEVSVTKETPIIPLREGVVVRFEGSEAKVTDEAGGEVRSTIPLSNLKIGDPIVVTTDVNILQTSNFGAKEIFYLE